MTTSGMAHRPCSQPSTSRPARSRPPIRSVGGYLKLPNGRALGNLDIHSGPNGTPFVQQCRWVDALLRLVSQALVAWTARPGSGQQLASSVPREHVRMVHRHVVRGNRDQNPGFGLCAWRCAITPADPGRALLRPRGALVCLRRTREQLGHGREQDVELPAACIRLRAVIKACRSEQALAL